MKGSNSWSMVVKIKVMVVKHQGRLTEESNADSSEWY